MNAQTKSEARVFKETALYRLGGGGAFLNPLAE